jgi:hypothetical protein
MIKYITLLSIFLFATSCNRKVNIYFSNNSLCYNPLHVKLIVDDVLVVDSLFNTNMIDGDFYLLTYLTNKKYNCFKVSSDNAMISLDTCFNRKYFSLRLLFKYSVASKEDLIGLPVEIDTVVVPKRFIFR